MIHCTLGDILIATACLGGGVSLLVRRQHEPRQIVGDLLAAEINEKKARSVKYQIATAKLGAIWGAREMALLHKSAADRTAPSPGQTYPTASVTGIPRPVKPLRNEPCRAIGPSDNGE